MSYTETQARWAKAAIAEGSFATVDDWAKARYGEDEGLKIARRIDKLCGKSFDNLPDLYRASNTIPPTTSPEPPESVLEPKTICITINM